MEPIVALDSAKFGLPDSDKNLPTRLTIANVSPKYLPKLPDDEKMGHL
tara:strand:+ start:583 stop:726 length:144 start_codon:yes stop_codon:yes gene_type:complete